MKIRSQLIAPSLALILSAPLALSCAHKAPPADALRSTMVDIELRGAPLRDVFAQISASADVAIEVAACVEGEVDARAEGVPALAALKLLAESAQLELHVGPEGVAVDCSADPAPSPEIDGALAAITTVAIDIELQGAPLDDVFRLIEDIDGDTRFELEPCIDGRTLDLTLSNAPLRNLVELIATNQGLVYDSKDKGQTILVHCSS